MERAVAKQNFEKKRFLQSLQEEARLLRAQAGFPHKRIFFNWPAQILAV